MSKIKLKSLFVLITFITVLNYPVFSQPENSCVDCHKKQNVVSSLPEWQQEIFAEWNNSLHAAKGVTCEKCHDGNPAGDEKEIAHTGVKKSSEPDSKVYYKNIPGSCGACHADVYGEFKKSLMFHNLEIGKLAPTCATCMGSHEVGIVDAIEVSEKCSICHNELMRTKPEVPGEAKRLLFLQEQVKGDLLKARHAIETAKERGKDTTNAEDALKEAEKRLEKSEVVWHRFAISGFEGEMLDASYYANRANNLASKLITRMPQDNAVQPPEKGICGPVLVLLIALLPIVVYRRMG